MERLAAEAIARLASEPLATILDMPGFEAYDFSAEDIPRQRPQLLSRLARLGRAHGIRGDYWSAWLTLTQLQPNDLDELEALDVTSAGTFALWCFASGDIALACAVYDRTLERFEVGSASSLHPSAILLCMLWLMHGGRTRDAARIGGTHARKFGESPGTTALMAAAQYLAGERSREEARRVVARFRPRSDGKYVEFVAPALHFIGERSASLLALGAYNQSTVFFPPVERVLRAIFGTEIDSVLHQPAPTAPPKVKWRGLVLTHSVRPTPHRFAPDGVNGPGCPGCSALSRVWFHIDVTKEKRLHQSLQAWSTFRATACMSCDYWMLRHDFRHDPDGTVHVVAVEGADQKLGTRHWETAIPAQQYARSSAAPATLEDMPLEGDCQLGGNPAWIQSPEDVRCPGCEKRMVFVLRFSSPNSFEGCPSVGNGSAALYYFACNECATSVRIAQWT